jgi:hypothetical protein
VSSTKYANARVCPNRSTTARHRRTGELSASALIIRGGDTKRVFGRNIASLSAEIVHARAVKSRGVVAK